MLWMLTNPEALRVLPANECLYISLLLPWVFCCCCCCFPTWSRYTHFTSSARLFASNLLCWNSYMLIYAYFILYSIMRPNDVSTCGFKRFDQQTEEIVFLIELNIFLGLENVLRWLVCKKNVNVCLSEKLKTIWYRYISK